MVAFKVPLAVIEIELAYPLPLLKLTSYPVGAVTVTFEVKFDPETVNVCAAEAVPKQLAKFEILEELIVKEAFEITVIE